MAKQFDRIEPAHREMMARQAIFFMGSSAGDSRVNIPPRSTAHFHVLGDLAVAYLDLTGSGSETAAHARAGGRATIMFCTFEGPPQILRLYGRPRIAFRGSPDYRAFVAERYPQGEPAGARQVVTIDLDLVQTSCGYAVPLFEHVGERPVLDRWAEAKGEEGLEAYRREKNMESIDGLPTGLGEA
ncbi:pyridoxamine 5'-phosphate oxidase family protein [Aureimonas flava]|uniref:Pyridoxamine 5'-phosphate oxidase family protein n=1 Tax=Aureimonas flava TaxID=2320271 RepID=A0A3A1WR34_9HYPH|nr:pyridoxamine 5'-phosphate oxidase family protein [Aureimonas flava]RIY03514.1 pyridoxamine 5'-phosphate oxidase family protein [Aureimonas flava]